MVITITVTIGSSSSLGSLGLPTISPQQCYYCNKKGSLGVPMRQATSKHDMLWAMGSSTRSISPHPPPLWASHILTQGTVACAGTMDMGTSWQWELARPCRASSGGWNVRWQSGNLDQGSGASRGEQKNYHVIPQTHSECTGMEGRSQRDIHVPYSVPY